MPGSPEVPDRDRADLQRGPAPRDGRRVRRGLRGNGDPRARLRGRRGGRHRHVAAGAERLRLHRELPRRVAGRSSGERFARLHRRRPRGRHGPVGIPGLRRSRRPPPPSTPSSPPRPARRPRWRRSPPASGSASRSASSSWSPVGAAARRRPTHRAHPTTPDRTPRRDHRPALDHCGPRHRPDRPDRRGARRPRAGGDGGRPRARRRLLRAGAAGAARSGRDRGLGCARDPPARGSRRRGDGGLAAGSDVPRPVRQGRSRVADRAPRPASRGDRRRRLGRPGPRPAVPRAGERARPAAGRGRLPHHRVDLRQRDPDDARPAVHGAARDRRVHRRDHDGDNGVGSRVAARRRGCRRPPGTRRAQLRSRRPRPRDHRGSGARRRCRRVDGRPGRPRRARGPTRHAPPASRAALLDHRTGRHPAARCQRCGERVHPARQRRPAVHDRATARC